MKRTNAPRPHSRAHMPESSPSSKRAKVDETTDARDVDASPTAMSASRRVAATLPRYLTFIEYDGHALHGFQRQSNTTLRTVQGALDDALTRFTGSRGPVMCVGSSRTDVGVHATRNSAHFDVGRASEDGRVIAYDETSVRRGLNYHLRQLGAAVRVTECVRVDELNPTFHARHDAVSRLYEYKLLVGDRDDGGSLFDHQRAWYVHAIGSSRGEGKPLSRDGTVRTLRAGFATCEDALRVDAMRRAAEILVGDHDFSSFRANGCQASSPMRSITSIDVIEEKTEWPAVQARGVKQRIAVRVDAPSFLYHQVRLIVGALKAVGAGDLTVDDVQKLLDAKDVSRAPPMAPACGLYLADVRYMDDYQTRPSYTRAASTEQAT